jgi:cytochrome c oxidase subunit 2
LLLVLITGLMVYFAFRYRRSRNPEPSDIRGDWRLETAWTVIPTLIALSMFYLGWTSYLGLRNVPDNALRIRVIGQQYSWVFVYPNEKTVEGSLVVPRGRDVKLEVSSQDVLHSLYIPAFRIKVDAVPGMDTHAWFHADRPGKYAVLCAEYCGTGHSDMTAVMRIVPEGEYRKWLEKDD